jgi:hypothetical protein
MIMKSNWFINILFILLSIGPALALGHLIEDFRGPLVAQAEASSEGGQLYQATCAKCHRLFTPTTLSQSQWTQIIQRFPNHFGKGDVRILDPKQEQILEDYLLNQGT